jgi:mono/diheme cytochrome c family protein
MKTLHPMDYRRGLRSARGNRNIAGRLVGAGCFFLVAAILACGWTRSPTRVVQAYSKSSKALGSSLFHERGCEHCHGVDGRDGDQGPDLSTIGRRWSKQQIEHQIVMGGAGMPAFGNALQPDEVKDLVDFLHAKRKAPKVKTVVPVAVPASEPTQ